MAEAAGIPGRKKTRSKSAKSSKKRITPEGVSSGYKEKIVTGTMDLPFFIIVLILLVIGIVMMSSASYAWAISEGLDGMYYGIRQLGMAGIGLICMFFASFVDYHKFKKPFIAYSFFLVTVILLFLCRVGPFKSPHNNSYRWVKIGPLPEFQPSEIMKMAIILLFAYIISINYSKMKKLRYGVVPFLGIIGVVAGLLMWEPHLSGTIIICAIGLIMMFVGGTRFSHLLALGVLGAAALGFIVYVYIQSGKATYFEQRWISWVRPFDPEVEDATWQTRNSLIAIGSGGFFGLGLGNSRQKFLYLPESKNDFVFAVVCEELGFIGAVMVLILFLLFIIRGFYISTKAPDKFGMMIAVGITIQIGIQALLNIAVVTNTIPNTGVSLPFFSYGGTALIMQLAEMGVVLNVSRQSFAE